MGQELPRVAFLLLLEAVGLRFTLLAWGVGQELPRVAFSETVRDSGPEVHPFWGVGQELPL